MFGGMAMYKKTRRKLFLATRSGSVLTIAIILNAILANGFVTEKNFIFAISSGLLWALYEDSQLFNISLPLIPQITNKRGSSTIILGKLC